MIILCVDYGDARTGLAVCDKSEILASPWAPSLKRTKTKLMEKIAETAKQRKAELIVVGDPSTWTAAAASARRSAVNLPSSYRLSAGFPLKCATSG